MKDLQRFEAEVIERVVPIVHDGAIQPIGVLHDEIMHLVELLNNYSTSVNTT